MEQMLVSLERFNSMCAEGNDRDYGKRAMRLFPVEKVLLCRQVRSCHDDRSGGGLESDEEARCYDEEGKAIRACTLRETCRAIAFCGLSAYRSGAEPFDRTDL